jgi:hypothetical protein
VWYTALQAYIVGIHLFIGKNLPVRIKNPKSHFLPPQTGSFSVANPLQVSEMYRLFEVAISVPIFRSQLINLHYITMETKFTLMLHACSQRFCISVGNCEQVHRPMYNTNPRFKGDIKRSGNKIKWKKNPFIDNTFNVVCTKVIISFSTWLRNLSRSLEGK